MRDAAPNAIDRKQTHRLQSGGDVCPSSRPLPPLTVTGFALGLPLGDYTGTVTVTAPMAANSPQTITTKLHVEEDIYRKLALPLILR